MRILGYHPPSVTDEGSKAFQRDEYLICKILTVDDEVTGNAMKVALPPNLRLPRHSFIDPGGLRLYRRMEDTSHQFYEEYLCSGLINRGVWKPSRAAYEAGYIIPSTQKGNLVYSLQYLKPAYYYDLAGQDGDEICAVRIARGGTGVWYREGAEDKPVLWQDANTAGRAWCEVKELRKYRSSTPPT